MSHHRPLGSLARRAVARALDMATVFALLFALVVIRVFWFMGDLADRWQPEPWGRAFVPTLTFVAIGAVYEVVFVAARGQTPGKDRLDLRVESVATGEPPGVVRTFVRWLIPGVLIIVPPLVLGLLAVGATGVTAVSARRRAVHDLVAGTRVVVYDADVEEGPLPKRSVSDDEGLSRYGPRHLWDQVFERGSSAAAPPSRRDVEPERDRIGPDR